MTTNKSPFQKNTLSEDIPSNTGIWIFCLASGIVLWGIGIALWIEHDIDEKVLFYYNTTRISHGPFIIFQEWLSQYGMAIISSIYIIYLIISHFNQRLNISKTIYLYTIFSYGISGILGDLIKEVLARPRPLFTYGNELFVLSQSLSPAIPSGHATKCVALAIPFILLVSNKDKLHQVIKWIMIILTGGVCFSRIVLGAHYVSDVIAGIGMGIMGLPFTMLFAKVILQRINPEQLPKMSKVWGMLLIFITIVFMAM